MAISKNETEKIAELARLKLDEREIDKFTEQLSSVLGNFEKLQKIGTKGVEPTSQVTGLHNIARQDEAVLDWKSDAKPEINRQKLLSNAPKEEDGFIKVPGVFNN